MRVVIAEDQVLLREGLRRLFEDAGHNVIEAVNDADRLRAAVSEHRPDLAVVDIPMPPTFKDEGIRAAGWIRDAHPEVAVLVLSQHVESTGAVRLVSRGGFGYLLKNRVLDVAEFLEAAERVARGGSALDPQVLASLIGAETDVLEALTEREREVLSPMAEWPDQQCDCPSPRARRAHDRRTRPQRAHEARAARERRRPSARARRDHLPPRRRGPPLVQVQSDRHRAERP